MVSEPAAETVSIRPLWMAADGFEAVSCGTAGAVSGAFPPDVPAGTSDASPQPTSRIKATEADLKIPAVVLKQCLVLMMIILEAENSPGSGAWT